MNVPMVYVIRCTTKNGNLYWGDSQFASKILCKRFANHDAALELAARLVHHVPDTSAKGTIRIVGLRPRVRA